MRVIIFGATGMIGHGVVKECLAHPDVEAVLTVGRRACPETDAKLTQLVHEDFLDLSPIDEELKGYDACFYCLGISAGGMKEADYRRITLDFTLAAARALTNVNPEMTMCFISGAGTSLSSRQMWARVKGEAEAALAELPFKAVHSFRPAFIQPMKGVKSTIASYRALYAVLSPFYFALKHLPAYVCSSEQLGLAMIHAVQRGADPVVENRDICALAER